MSQAANPFRSRRRELRLTQQSLAARLGVSPVSIWNWEHDVSVPRADRIAEIASALEVSAETVIQWLSQQHSRVHLQRGAA